jgi:transposase
LELPEATPHSARHSFISMLQAAGIAVATVVKFDGHANPVTTLNVYSNAVRGSEAAAKVLGVCMWEDEESLGLDLDVELACFPQGFSALYGREKSDRPGTGEQHVRDIRRATRRKWSSEEKIRIVLSGLRGEYSIAELCRREGIADGLYYSWSKEFLEAGKKRLAGDTQLPERPPMK